jgi:hypothetical protein
MRTVRPIERNEMPKQHLKEAWLSYRNAVMPGNAPSAQIIECRRAFYAGAQAFFTATMRHLEPGTEETDNDMAFMAGLDAELQEFNEQVKKGLA